MKYLLALLTIITILSWVNTFELSKELTANKNAVKKLHEQHLKDSTQHVKDMEDKLYWIAK